MVESKVKKLKVFAESRILKLSASSIKTYEQCPRKWYYTYLDKPDIPPKDWSHLTLGNFIHDVLEYFHNDLLSNPEKGIRGAMSQACKGREVTSDYKQKLTPEIRQEVRGMLLAYLDLLESGGMPNVQSNERNFSVNLDKDLLIRGKIDRVDLGVNGNPNMYHIVDYKSGKSKHLDDFQLLVYGIPILDENPEMENYTGSYLALKENMKWITSTFTRTDVEKVKAKIRDIASKIRCDRTWEPKSQFLCKWCDYNIVCEDAPANKLRGGLPKPFVGGECDWE